MTGCGVFIAFMQIRRSQALRELLLLEETFNAEKRLFTGRQREKLL